MKSGKNVGKVLGELESNVMEIVWRAKKPVSVSDVINILSKQREIAYTTVMTIMGRLTDKGLLKRTASGKAYIYKPMYSKDTFLSRISRQIIRNLVSSFGDTAIAHFTEELEHIPSEKKKKLLEILKSKKS